MKSVREKTYYVKYKTKYSTIICPRRLSTMIYGGRRFSTRIYASTVIFRATPLRYEFVGGFVIAVSWMALPEEGNSDKSYQLWVAAVSTQNICRVVAPHSMKESHNTCCNRLLDSVVGQRMIVAFG
jgi:hypothetical protein